MAGIKIRPRKGFNPGLYKWGIERRLSIAKGMVAVNTGESMLAFRHWFI